MFRTFLLAAATLHAGATAAQQPQYDSAFTAYQPYREQPVADWRAVNEEVGRIGGHIGIVGGASGHASHGTAKPSAADGQPPQRGAPAAHGHPRGAR